MRLCLTLIFLFYNLAQGTANDFYRAAVVDFEPEDFESSISMEDYALKNANKMIPFIEKAANKQADIIVFPETGLFSTNKTYFIAVPDPSENVTPSDNSSYAPVLRLLSSLAIKYEIYIVVNLHENYTTNGDTKKYNTDVVFNRNGTIITRYRKYHLFDETGIDIPSEPQYAYFETDFGVTFGIFTCFDILFSQPAEGLVQKYNISHFVYPSAWFNEVPFLTSIEAQNAFAFGNDVVVLGSGLNHIKYGHDGSGIYRGRTGKPLTYLSNKNGTTLLFAEIPKTVGNNSAVNYTNDYIDDSDTTLDDGNLFIFSENMTDYTSSQIETDYESSDSSEELTASTGDVIGTKKTFTIQKFLCDGDLCCQFNVTLENQYIKPSLITIAPSQYSLSNYLYYRFVVANGQRSYFVEDVKGGQEICGIISCLNSTASSCAQPFTGTLEHPIVEDSTLGSLYLNSTGFTSVEITGNFTNKNVLATMSGMSFPDEESEVGKLINYENVDFSTQNYSDYLTINLKFNDSHLVSGGIYVRNFNLDVYNSSTGGGAASNKPSIEVYSIMAGITTVLGLFQSNHIFG